jgi:hypothetical protein
MRIRLTPKATDNRLGLQTIIGDLRRLGVIGLPAL